MSTHYYFIGIGGIGMSALAHYVKREGHRVSGYDRTPSVVTEALVERGIEVSFAADPARLETVDRVVYTPAIPADFVELKRAKEMGLPLVKRAELLGEISKKYRTLAVGGTHGKTTTSSLLVQALRGAGVDATAFIGGISHSLDGNYAYGSSDWMVTEADEFDRSFLTLHPEIAILTSLDADHLDIYGDGASVESGYRAFAGQVQKELFVPVELADQTWPVPTKSYGIESGDFRAEALRFEGLTTRFNFVTDGLSIPDICLPLPGRHNVLNATAAAAVALRVGADPKKIGVALSNFGGIYRRFDTRFDAPDLTYVDDYAHHPTEIDAAIETARSLFPDRKLYVIFQPHLYSRTRDFAEGFARSLDRADRTWIMPIYPARELPISGVSSEFLREKMTQPAASVITREELLSALDENFEKPAVLLTLGAGDIDREVPRIQKWMEEKYLLQKKYH